MAINNFNDLNGYVEQLSSLASNFYDDKVNVNEIDSNLLSTHVTAEDLNHIKTSLSAVIENVNAINNHLINYQSSIDENERQTASDTISNSLNNYLANDYIRKDQLIVDEKYVNDSVAHLDDVYLRSKNIFIDGYKISTASQYNLVSFNQLTLTINGLTGSFNAWFANLSTSIMSKIESLNRNVPSAITVSGFQVYGGLWVNTHYLTTDSNRCININPPLEELRTGLSAYTAEVFNSLYNKIDKNYFYFKTIEENEYFHGMRLIGSGYKFFSKNDIFDPSYREYKYFRVYSANTGTTVDDISIFFAPYHSSLYLGYDFPISGTINGNVNNTITVDNRDASYKQFSTYILRTRLWDYMQHSQGPTNEIIEYQDRYDLIYQGWTRGWMECGGQQRVYAEVKDGYVYLKPSAILFPIPFDTGQGLDIQVTVKRDCVQPLTSIIPVCVVDEDTYYFTIAGGGQGIPNGTSGYMYIKWNAKGVYLVNNLLQLYYLQQGYDKIHNLYWINKSTVNPRLTIGKTNDPLRNYLSSEELFQDLTKDQLLNFLVDDFQQQLSAIVNYYYACTQWFWANVDLSNVTLNLPPHPLYCDSTAATGPEGADPNNPLTWGYALAGHYIRGGSPACIDYRPCCVYWAPQGLLSSNQKSYIDPENLVWQQTDYLGLEQVYTLDNDKISTNVDNKWTGAAGTKIVLNYRKGDTKYHFLLGTEENNSIEFKIDELWHYHPHAIPVSTNLKGEYGDRTDMDSFEIGINRDLSIVSGTYNNEPFSSVYWKCESDYYYNTAYYINGEAHPNIPNTTMNNYGNRSLISLTSLRQKGITNPDLNSLYTHYVQISYDEDTGYFFAPFSNGEKMNIEIPKTADKSFEEVITEYPFIIKAMGCCSIQDKLNILPHKIPIAKIDFNTDNIITNIIGSGYIANDNIINLCTGYTDHTENENIRNRIKNYLGLILSYSNIWDKTKIRDYTTTYSTTEKIAYIEPNSKTNVYAKELWEKQKPGENYATRKPWSEETYWYREDYPSVTTVDDDRLRLRSTKLKTISSWMKYDERGNAWFDDKDN